MNSVVKHAIAIVMFLITGCATPNPVMRNDESGLTTATTTKSSMHSSQQSLESSVTAILSTEPLDGKNFDRYIVQAKRSVFGSGTNSFRVKDDDRLNCWLFNSGKQLPCLSQQMAQDFATDLQSTRLFQFSYLTYAIVKSQTTPNQARVLLLEIHEYTPPQHYWELVVERVGGQWQKQTLIKHPMPFPSTW